MNLILKTICLLFIIQIFTASQVDLLVPSPQKINILGQKQMLVKQLGFNFDIKQYNKNTNKEEQLKPYYEIIKEYEQNRFQKKQMKKGFGQEKSVNVVLNNLDQPSDFVDIKTVKENYKINILENKNTFDIEFICEGYVSFVRALETLYQLIDEQCIIKSLPLMIEDSPSYKWRGIMLDTTRHFLTVEKILGQINAMRVNKLNVLHIHFTDSESFPVFIPELPELSKYGAYNQDSVYSQSDIDQIQKACQASGILLVPEFDTPAHTRSWSLSPEYAETNACGDYPPSQWLNYCMEPPCGALDPTIQKTWDLVNGVTKYQSSTYDSNYLHMGGDEVVAGCWDFQPNIKTWMNDNGISNYKELETYFRNEQAKQLPSNKNPIYWINSADSKNVQYNDNAVLQYWDSEEGYDLLKEFQNDIITSTYDYLYLDCGLGDPQGSSSWCDPYKTWARVYTFQPQNADIGDRLLGSEAPLWAEEISNNNIDNSAWPRATSLALRLWNVDEQLKKPALVKKLVNMVETLEKNYDMEPAPVTSQYCSLNVDMCFFDNDPIYE